MKIILLLLMLLILAGYSSGQTDRAVSTGRIHPRLIHTKYPADEPIIASFIVTDAPYLADETGKIDATSAFQKAFDDAAGAGGGVVFAPAGSYRFDGNLKLERSVTLHGDSPRPTKWGAVPGPVKGTLLKVYAGKGEEDGAPFITLNEGASVQNLAIFYPDQKINSITPYPWTVKQPGGDSISVINVTIVNPYQGILCGGAANELHYLRDVRATPLKTGIQTDRVYDVGRIEQITFAPGVWAASGLSGSPSEEQIVKNVLGDPESTGIRIGYNDWEVMTNIAISGISSGIRFVDVGGDSNGNIYGLKISHTRNALRFDYANPYGWSISNGSLNSDEACVLASPSYKGACAQFTGISFTGSGSAVRQEVGSNGTFSFANCRFATSGKPAMLDVQSGAIILKDCRFAPATGITLAQIDPSARSIGIEETKPVTSVANKPAPIGWSFAPRPRPTGTAFVVAEVDPFGAQDATASIQTALDNCGKSGGGTVYIIAGMIRVNGHLNVPTGVELRGVNDSPHHTAAKGTVLLAYAEGDRGKMDGVPFITLQAKSGIRGIGVYYPDQEISDITPYPWTVQSRGAGCWAIYVNIVNGWQGVDFGTYPSAGHVVDYLSGAALKTGLFVGSSSARGWVENVHYNPHYWARSGGYPGKKPGGGDLDCWSWQKQNGTAMKFGFCTGEQVMGTFVFGAHVGLQLIDQPGKGAFSGVIEGHGTDGSPIGAQVSAVGKSGVKFSNFQVVSFDVGNFLIVDESVKPTDKIEIINCNCWTAPAIGFDIRSGNVLMNQVHFTEGGQNGIRVTGGNVMAEACYFSKPIREHVWAYAPGKATVTYCLAGGGINLGGDAKGEKNGKR